MAFKPYQNGSVLVETCVYGPPACLCLHAQDKNGARENLGALVCVAWREERRAMPTFFICLTLMTRGLAWWIGWSVRKHLVGLLTCPSLVGGCAWGWASPPRQPTSMMRQGGMPLYMCVWFIVPVIHSRSSFPRPQRRYHHHHHYHISKMADALVWECVKVRGERTRQGRMMEGRANAGCCCCR